MYRFVLCLCIAVAAAIPLHYEQEHHYAPKYSYKYQVKDPFTDDYKSQWETRNGDKVQGSYKLMEPDGTIRTVDYEADGHKGFRAIVTREKHGHKEITVHGHHSEEGVKEVVYGHEGGYGGEVAEEYVGGEVYEGGFEYGHGLEGYGQEGHYYG